MGEMISDVWACACTFLCLFLCRELATFKLVTSLGGFLYNGAGADPEVSYLWWFKAALRGNCESLLLVWAAAPFALSPPTSPGRRTENDHTANSCPSVVYLFYVVVPVVGEVLSSLYLSRLRGRMAWWWREAVASYWIRSDWSQPLLSRN